MDFQNQADVSVKRTLPLLTDFLPDEYRKKAEMELNETPENSVRLLQELKLMAQNETETEGIEFHEDFLRQFLRQSKYDVEKALKRLQAFVNYKRRNPNVFSHVDPEKLEKVPDYKYCSVLPWRCQDGCTIVTFEQGKWSTEGITCEDLIRLGQIVYQQSLRNPMTQINGFKIIIDGKDYSLRQIKYLTPSAIYTTYKSFLDCTPARNKEIHLVNNTPGLKIMWTLFKPFLSAKMKSRLHFHSSPQSLLKFFPKHALPVRYGGDLENYYLEDWMKEANEQQRISTLSGQCNVF